jgi:hypothetical protein
MHHSAHPIVQSVVKSVAITPFSARFASLRCIPPIRFDPYVISFKLGEQILPITYFDQTTKQNPENLYSAFFTSRRQSSFAHSSNTLRSPCCCIPPVLLLCCSDSFLNLPFTPIGQSPSTLSYPTPRTSFLDSFLITSLSALFCIPPASLLLA